MEEKGKNKVGDNRLIDSYGYIRFEGIHTNKDGKTIKIKLNRAIYVPNLWTNLFSICAATSLNSTKVICEENLISVVSGDNEIHFDKVLSHGKGKVLVADFNQPNNQKSYESEFTQSASNKMTYNELDKVLGHAIFKVIKDSASNFGITLHENECDLKCPECSLGKSRIRNFGHEKTATSEKGEKIYLDISGIKSISFGGVKYWLLLQDDFTDYLWSYFISSKDKLYEKIIDC